MQHELKLTKKEKTSIFMIAQKYMRLLTDEIYVVLGLKDGGDTPSVPQFHKKLFADTYIMSVFIGIIIQTATRIRFPVKDLKRIFKAQCLDIIKRKDTK